ncbi:MAG: DUF1460 domain-containing protein [Deltaproteobacteria bacterium]|nr:DUF1460 domain-containing protein [Deltaproteobacteria bacterium]
MVAISAASALLFPGTGNAGGVPAPSQSNTSRQAPGVWNERRCCQSKLKKINARLGKARFKTGAKGMKGMDRNHGRKSCRAPLGGVPTSGELALEIGRLFLGAPYRAGTLTTGGREKLLAILTAFDCTTFVETILALTRAAASGSLTPARFRGNLRFIRYRQGRMEGYASRLHYFTDWLRDNQKKKVLRDVSGLLGGRPVRKTIDFMTAHRDLYAGLKSKDQFCRMRTIEKKLSRRIFHIVDQRAAAKRPSAIRGGDIIALATDREGLDVAHVGFAIRQNGHWHLLHASSKENAVVISKETLLGYLKAHPDLTGILIARIL